MDFLSSTLVTRKSIVVPPPAAGADWSTTVGGSGAEQEPQGWLLKSVAATLVAASGATPSPVLLISDAAGHVVAASPGATSAQTSGSTVLYCWAGEGSPAAIVAGYSLAALPGAGALYLPSGFTIGTATNAIGAASQWGPITILATIDG